MLYFQISALFGGIVGFFIGILVLLRGGRKHLNTIYALLSIASGLWSFGQYGYYFAVDKTLALVACRFSDAVAILIPVFFLHFIFLFVQYSGKARRLVLFWAYFIAACFLIFSPTKFFISDVVPKMMFPWFPVSGGMIYSLFGVFFFIVLAVAFYVLFSHIAVASSLVKTQLRYVAVASVLGFIGGGTSFPLVYDIKFPPYGFILFSCYPIIIAYAILKHHLMDIRLAITKVTIFFTIYVMTFAVPFYIGYATKSWVLSTLCMAILATLGPIMHRSLQTKAENVLLAKQKRYQKFLLNSARGMIQEHDLSRLLRLTVYVIKRSVKPQFVAIFLKNDMGNYSLKAWRNHGLAPKDLVLPLDHPMITLLNSKREAVIWDEAKAVVSQLPFAARLIVPANNDKELLGFMVMGEKEDGTVYTEDDCNVFDILSNQAALAIDNCLYMEAAKRNQQRLFEAEKLASIGGMAAGMSHQFKNRLNSFLQIAGGLSSVCDYFKNKFGDLYKSDAAFKDNLDYFVQCTDDVTKEAKRCSFLVQGIIGFARDKASPSVQEFSLFDIIESSLYLVRVKHQCLETQLPFELVTDITLDGKLYTVKSHISEIIFNLLDNAFESIEENIKYRLSPQEQSAYKPFVKISLTKRDSKILISISDNGTGIKEEDKPKIFAPFFTTKSSMISGMGMGMYIIKRMIVEQLRGKMWFESQYQQGTTFYIELPQSVSKI